MAPENPGSRFDEAMEKSAFATVKPGEKPEPEALWAAVGKTRGVVEALLPGIGFLVVYTITADVAWSVSAPVVLAVLFIAARLIQRSPALPAVAGLVGIAASAGVALWSGRAEDNFLLGFIVNAVWVLGLLVSLLLRRPLVGVIAGVLTGDAQWHESVATRRIAMITTWMWLGVFSLRLFVQVPLFLAGAVQALAIAKLLMGIPLYAIALWFTWLLMRAAYRGRVETPQ
jgi:hypothetical protein